jgi:hypothetical protein
MKKDVHAKAQRREEDSEMRYPFAPSRLRVNQKWHVVRSRIPARMNMLRGTTHVQFGASRDLL